MLISFDGVEATTDLALYMIYKFFRKSDLWSKLKTVTFDSCRYVTDFGIEVLYEAVGKTNLIDKRTCAGCKKIIKYSHVYEEKQKNERDLFALPSFTKITDAEVQNANLLNTCKVLILNDAHFSFIKYFETKTIFKAGTIIDFAQFKFEKPATDGVSFVDYKYNLIEVDWVSTIFFYSGKLYQFIMKL